MDGWMDGRMDGWTDGWMDGWMDGRMDGWTDGRMDGWMDGWIDLEREALERGGGGKREQGSIWLGFSGGDVVE